MLLRDHPLMTYKGVPSWPPAWLRRVGCYENTHPTGEIGILKGVLPSTLPPPKICFLTIEHCNAEYIGALLLSDPVFLSGNLDDTSSKLRQTDAGHWRDRHESYTLSGGLVSHAVPFGRLFGLKSAKRS